MLRKQTDSVHRSPAVCRLVVSGVLLLTALTAGASIARAQTNLAWSPDGATPGTGGTATWDNKSAVWFDGTSFVSWTNSTFNNAIFSGTAGTVTVKGALKVHDVTFNTAGYTITDGKLNMGDSVATILGSGTISSSIGGTAGLRFTGGTLTLLAASTYSGGTIVEDGTLVVDGRHQNNRVPRNSLVTVNSGGTFRILGVNALPTHVDSVDVAVNAGGTLNVVSGSSPLLSGEGSHAHLRNLTLNSGNVVTCPSKAHMPELDGEKQRSKYAWCLCHVAHHPARGTSMIIPVVGARLARGTSRTSMAAITGETNEVDYFDGGAGGSCDGGQRSHGWREPGQDSRRAEARRDRGTWDHAHGLCGARNRHGYLHAG